jgi:20S proteasome alpha/beta subunit
MTICIAALFRWNYGTTDAPQHGVAAIAVSDRKITAGDIEYEPQQLKSAFITRRALVLIAGDISLHSGAIAETNKQVRGNIDMSPHNLALIYSQAIQSIKRREAENLYLAPIGLNTDTFLAQQKDLSDGFVDRLTAQLQDYRGGDVEAIIVASDGENAHIITVDPKGLISHMDDVGFAAIGIGAWHAKSRLMQSGYVNSAILAPALAAVFAAKRAAETAPGVGTVTDIYLLFKNDIEPILPDVAAKLVELYKRYSEQVSALGQATVAELGAFLEGAGERRRRDSEKKEEGVEKPGSGNSTPGH